jgi:carbamoyltransferase
MPFAPVILDEYADDILEDYHIGTDNAPFMTSCWKVRNDWKSKIPAVVHKDGTVRPQVIKREDNPFYYDIVDEFRKLTGVPALINTSFNVHEDPIVCFDREADFALQTGKIDILVEGGHYEKNKSCDKS